MLEFLTFPLATEESSCAVLHQTRLALAKTRDVGRDEVFGAHALPGLAGSSCCEGTLTLDAAREGLLLSHYRGGWRATGYGGGGKIKELVGRHAKMFAVGGALWGEARLELHGGRGRDGGGVGRCRKGII